MAGRFLNLFHYISRILPEIKLPERKVKFNEKLFWTALVLVLFLVMSETPLYGVAATGGDQLQALRIIFASNRGTLMELGIGPIVTAGLILQLLVGSAIIEADMGRSEDRKLFTSASKTFSIILTGVQASAYIAMGMYGTLPGPTSLIVFLQLIGAGLIVLLLDELVQKGWGFGSGISLFIMAGVAQGIFWQLFSPAVAIGETGNSYGLVPAIAQVLLGGQPISLLILRGGANPSLLGLVATLVTFIVVIYIEGVRLELPISYAGYKGYRSKYPIKLLYVSNLPVIFASALFANVYFFSQLLWSRFNPTNTNFFFNLLGTYVQDGANTELTGGLAYYVTSPRSFPNVLADPIRALVYLGILVGFCIIFSLTWLEVGGLGPSTVAKQLVDSGMQIPGYRRSGRAIESILKRYIPAVTVMGGIVVGLVAGLSDFFGVFGSGTGILLSIGIIYQYYETLVKEKAMEMYPAFRKLLGG